MAIGQTPASMSTSSAWPATPGSSAASAATRASRASSPSTATQRTSSRRRHQMLDAPQRGLAHRSRPDVAHALRGGGGRLCPLTTQLGEQLADEEGTPPVASWQASAKRGAGVTPSTRLVSSPTASQLSAAGRSTAAPGSERTAARRSEAGSDSPGRSATATTSASESSRRPRWCRNLVDAGSAQCASSTINSNGRCAARFATSQYSPCRIPKTGSHLRSPPRPRPSLARAQRRRTASALRAAQPIASARRARAAAARRRTGTRARALRRAPCGPNAPRLRPAPPATRAGSSCRCPLGPR